jgi:hypothetical protein
VHLTFGFQEVKLPVGLLTVREGDAIPE